MAGLLDGWFAGWLACWVAGLLFIYNALVVAVPLAHLIAKNSKLRLSNIIDALCASCAHICHDNVLQLRARMVVMFVVQQCYIDVRFVLQQYHTDVEDDWAVLL